MTRDEFLTELQDALQRDDPLTPDMVLGDMPEWDSLAVMTVSSFFDQTFSKTLHFTDFQSIITVEDLLKKAGL